MALVVASSTQAVVDVIGTAWASANIPFRQVLPTGTIIAWGWTSGVKASGANDFAASLYDVATGSPVALIGGVQLWTALSGGASYSVTLAAPADAALLLMAGGGTGHHSAGTLYGFTVNVTTPAGYCQYGGQIKVGLPDFVVLVAANLLSIVSALKANWALSAMSFFLGDALDLRVLCTTPREAEPVFGVDDVFHLITGSDPLDHEALLQKAGRWLKWAAWPEFCECVPGSPTPLPPPSHNPPKPPGVPDHGHDTFTCDIGDLCTQMAAISLTVNAISQRLQQTDKMITLIQRQHVPFAYLLGTNHPGLTLSGSFTVAGILGLAVTASVVPAWLGKTADNPTTYYTIGWISLGTADGWSDRHEIRHSEQLLLEVPAETTRVGYNFEVGVTASIRELVREP